MVNEVQAGTGEEMVIHHSSFRHNKGIALDIDNTAKLGTRMWNILFADGDNDAIRLNDSQSMHFVNITFVKNKLKAIDGTASVYNSLAWRNGENSIKEEGDRKQCSFK